MSKSFKVHITTLAQTSLNSYGVYSLYEAITIRYFLLEYVPYILYFQLDFPVHLYAWPVQSVYSQRMRTCPVFLCIPYSPQHRAGSSKYLFSNYRHLYTLFGTQFASSLKSGKVSICQMERAPIIYLMEEEKQPCYLTLIKTIKKYEVFTSCRVTTSVQRIKEREGGRRDMAAFMSL